MRDLCQGMPHKGNPDGGRTAGRLRKSCENSAMVCPNPEIWSLRDLGGTAPSHCKDNHNTAAYKGRGSWPIPSQFSSLHGNHDSEIEYYTFLMLLLLWSK
jgi:hypothetical protein